MFASSSINPADIWSISGCMYWNCSSIMTQQASSAITVPALPTLCTHTHTQTHVTLLIVFVCYRMLRKWTLDVSVSFNNVPISLLFPLPTFRRSLRLPSSVQTLLRLLRLPKTETASSTVTSAIYLPADRCRILCSSALLSPDPIAIPLTRP